jgi:hypothetical protein
LKRNLLQNLLSLPWFHAIRTCLSGADFKTFDRA